MRPGRGAVSTALFVIRADSVVFPHYSIFVLSYDHNNILFQVVGA